MRTTKEIAQVFVKRAETLGLKGRKRDDAALEFMCGAAAASDQINELMLMLVSVRGFSAVQGMASV